MPRARPAAPLVRAGMPASNHERPVTMREYTSLNTCGRLEAAARRAAGLGSSLLLACALGCGSDTKESGNAGGKGELYAVMYEVYDNEESTSYLSILDTLDIEKIDPRKAREYGSGRAFIQAYNGFLYVGESESPTVTRYAVGEDGALTEKGTLSFANYGLREGQFDSWNATFIDENKAYLMDFVEGRTIIWNPTTMEITGDIPPEKEFAREGWSFEGSPAVVRDGLLYRTFNWANYDDAKYSTDLLLAIYDVKKDELVELVKETRCPAPGNLVHQDEDGNIYFSNWIWPVARTIMNDAPESCVLRINAGEKRFDRKWTLNYRDFTDGHYGAMFSYLNDGQALVSAFYDERTSFDEETSPWSYVGSLNWRIWSIDMEDPKKSAPLQGIDFNGGAFTPIKFDDRVFLMVPGGEEEGYATQMYEVVDGEATPYVELPGWSYQFVKLR
jgi:hypothetical protein